MELVKLCQLTEKLNQSLLSWGAPEPCPPPSSSSFPPLYIGTKCQLDLTCWLLPRLASIIKWISPCSRSTDLWLNCYFSVLFFFPVNKENEVYCFLSSHISCHVVNHFCHLLPLESATKHILLFVVSVCVLWLTLNQNSIQSSLVVSQTMFPCLEYNIKRSLQSKCKAARES